MLDLLRYAWSKKNKVLQKKVFKKYLKIYQILERKNACPIGATIYKNRLWAPNFKDGSRYSSILTEV